MKALLVGDTHFPWVNEERVNRILDKVDRMQPDIVAQMGDLYDLYSFSRYVRTLNLISPKDELVEARLGAETFWRAIRDAAPRARCIQLLGNHDERMMKLAVAKAPELEALLEMLDYWSLWRFDGVELPHLKADTEVEVEDLDSGRSVILMHGHRARLGDHVKYNQQSTVVGHSHHGGVYFHRYRGETVWELNCGYIADQASKPLSYGPQRLSNSVPGYGVIDSDGPRFIAM